MRFSIRNLLLWVLILALGLTVVVQFWQHREETLRHEREVRDLHRQLQAAHQALNKLPVEDPQRAYVLAMPSFTYARWVWRVYLPPGSRYALRMAVGSAVDQAEGVSISSVDGESQQMGYQGQGETTVIVERIPWGKHSVLGVSLGGHQEVSCLLTPEVARCLSQRLQYRERQLGTSGTEDFATNERIDLLQRWYPKGSPNEQDSKAGKPVGFSVWLEPL